MKSWMRFSIVCLFLGLYFSANAELITQTQQVKPQLWQSPESSESTVQAKTIDNTYSKDNSYEHSFEDAQLMKLDVNLMRRLLSLNDSGIEIAAKSLDGQAKQYDISLPLPNGEIIDLSLVKESVLAEQLTAKYPEINTYRVLPNKRVFSGKVDISPSGFHAMLQMFDGEVVFIDPTELSNSKYVIYLKSTQKTQNHRKHSCGVNDGSFAKNGFTTNSFGNHNGFNVNRFLSSPMFSARGLENNTGVVTRNQGSLKNYAIAIATTGEYSAKFGGTVAGTMAAITTTLNRVNQILERDLGIHLNLVENNDLLINTDANSDPFTETKLINLVLQNQEFIDSMIGNANYDIGHLLTTSGGGLAAIASICNNTNKAKGVSGITSPRGDSFDLDFVAHEIGHQLGATHTFNSIQGACSEETRTAKSAFEPGSGSSIMSYAGYCGLDNIQSNTDAMYHIGSIKQITDYTNNGFGNRCGEVKSSQNTPPQVDAGRDYTIPARTPFELDGTASDEDGDSLVYAWEQLDAGDTSTESADKGNNALFRVHTPNASKSRSFPALVSVLNRQPIKGETLPNYQRNLTMSFVAQDGVNAASSDEMTVKVMRTGSRFAMNYPRAHYTRGNTYAVLWNVANTDKAPINCTSVNILLSLDGGKNFEYPIANNIQNNGETLVTIPVDIPTSTQGRFKIKCSDNVFYAVSYRNFFVTKDDNSISIEYNNEDQAESNLNDLPLDTEPIISSSVTNTASSGGGSFGYLIYLFMFIGFIRKHFKY